MTISKDEGASTGPSFVGHKGKLMSGAEMDLLFHVLLLEVQRRFAKVLPKSVNVKKEFSTYSSVEIIIKRKRYEAVNVYDEALQ